MRRILAIFIQSSLVLAALVLIVRAIAGPFHFLVSIHSPVNAQSLFGVLLAISIVWLSVRETPTSPHPAVIEPAWAGAAAVALLAIVCFYRALSFSYLSDDYNLLEHSSQANPSHVVLAFTRSGDGFFRPLGHITLWIIEPWAKLDPWRWHVPSLAAHAATTVLVYFFVRRLYPAGRIALLAAALFAVHGSHPETVNWMASWFGSLATLLSMAALLLFLRYRDRRESWVLAASLVCLAAALATKESAFVLPALALIIASRPWRAAIRLTLPYWIVTILVGLYRAAVVGGIGGYKLAGSSDPQALHLSAIGLLKALALRVWSVLVFPLNWSVEPEWFVIAALAAALVAMLWLARARVQRERLWVPLAFILIPSLPVAHLLLIGSDLLNARSVYMSTIGFSLLIAVAIAAIEPARLRPWIAAAILLFQIAALEHNLTIRGRTADLARQTCRDLVDAAGRSNGLISAEGVPGILDGSHFFANGLRQCVELTSGGAARFDAGAPPSLTWNPATRKLVPH